MVLLKKMKYNFCIIGVAGYIAPRHLLAIKNLKHNLLLAYDKSSVVGILDKYFPKALFFNKYNLFKKKFISLKKIDYTVILTPNYTHFSFIVFCLKNKSHVICEKPLVLSVKQLNVIKKLEIKFNRNVYTILQLRTLKKVDRVKKAIKLKKNYKVDIKYITPRGNWYQSSWKGDHKKSGGIIFNIGIHLLDLLCYLFGSYTSFSVKKINQDTVKGKVSFSNADVKFYLSIKNNFLKKNVVRNFSINNKKLDLSENFNLSHQICYEQIIKKKLFDTNSVTESIKLAENITNAIL